MLTPLQRRRGLPIGNLTSQFFANLYLSDFDHFIKETLKARQYLRYVDDFCLFSNDRQFLADARPAIEQYLTHLRLKIHPIKSQLFSTHIGANFVGFRVLNDRIWVRSQNLRRARQRLHRLQTHYLGDRLPLPQAHQSLQSWFAHLNHADTWRLQQQILGSLRSPLADTKLIFQCYRSEPSSPNPFSPRRRGARFKVPLPRERDLG